MRKLFKRSEEESSSWQSYTDLMAGFLAVFIIAAIVGVISIKGLVGEIGELGGSIGEIRVKLLKYKQLRDIDNAINSLDSSKYFFYNKKYRRIEYKKDILFQPMNPAIPVENYNDLNSAGREIATFVNTRAKIEYLGFKVIIEGRTANSHSNPVSYLHEDSKILSFQRAMSLYYLWQLNGIIDEIKKNENVEIFISGSGMEGKGRYKGLGPNGEDRNKLFIIQIVPYLIIK